MKSKPFTTLFQTQISYVVATNERKMRTDIYTPYIVDSLSETVSISALTLVTSVANICSCSDCVISSHQQLGSDDTSFMSLSS